MEYKIQSMALFTTFWTCCKNLWITTSFEFFQSPKVYGKVNIKSKAPFGWSEHRKDGKGRVENKKENDVFPCLV